MLALFFTYNRESVLRHAFLVEALTINCFDDKVGIFLVSFVDVAFKDLPHPIVSLLHQNVEEAPRRFHFRNLVPRVPTLNMTKIKPITEFTLYQLLHLFSGTSVPNAVQFPSLICTVDLV